MMSKIDLVIKAQQAYLSGDLVMSELLRYKDFKKLSNADKSYLIKWAGEDEFVTVDESGSIVNIKEDVACE